MKDSTLTQHPSQLLHSRPVAQEMLGGIGLTTLDMLLNKGKLKRIKIGRRSLHVEVSKIVLRSPTFHTFWARCVALCAVE